MPLTRRSGLMAKPTNNTVWSGPNYLAQEGARQLAKRLEAYWRKRGFEIALTIGLEDGIVSIRSNLINGHPRSSAKRV